MQQFVVCRTLYNQTKSIPVEQLEHRPSVYGIVLHGQQVLLAQSRFTQKYVLPGGGIEKGEAVEAALRREVWEETGVQVEVNQFLHFETDFFYYDPLDLALHGFLFYYRCTPLTLTLEPPPYPDVEDLEFPLWAEIASLTPESFQAHGTLILRLIEQCRTQVAAG